MKKLIAIMCASLLTYVASAQTESGSFYISLGNAYSPISEYNYLFRSNGVSFGTEWVTGITIDGNDDDFENENWTKNQTQKTSNFNLGGQFGYFVTDGVLTGIGIEIGSFTSKYSNEYDMDGDGYDDYEASKGKSSSLALSPFAKYYIPLGRNSLFISTSYTYGILKSSNKYEIDYSSMPNYEDYKDYGEIDPIKTSRLEFGTGMVFFLTKSVSLEPSVNYAFNTYTQEEEVYIGNNQMTGVSVYDYVTKKTKTNAFYFKIAASLYF
mgnify:CR=1 FL=1|tara:strand:- start:230 stop:1030 length:801 start_codon:yes stop_codon:yes gene_type:complete